jgi:hypothetical protein
MFQPEAVPRWIILLVSLCREYLPLKFDFLKLFVIFFFLF